jgi:uncharacterized protein
MNVYFSIIQQMAQSLRNLQKIISKAEVHATEKKFEADVYLALRLYPNMLPFSAQIRIMCDTSKFAAAFLAGKTPPSHDDTEKTFAEFKQRLQLAIEYLETFKESDFSGAAETKVSPKSFNGKHMTGHDYLICRQIPNFHFHLVTAYDILRQAGVEIGKTDYLGVLPLRD